LGFSFKQFYHLKDTITSYKIIVTGLVQGVGFRPFIYRIAHESNIKGWVENNIRGVTIEAEAKIDDLESFVIDIKKKAPPASDIEEILVEEIPVKGYAVFEIRESSDGTSGITEISPDIAICNDCLDDLKQQSHRIDYPFTNCTNCGPRFTIIKDLPYDRHQTTMDVFAMCDVCRKEYTDVLDRRFHAQPVACNHCGPEYTLIENEITYSGFETILNKTVELVESGKIIAIKGMGGFHLMCDATNEEAVSNLRRRKLREGKPFAVMFRNMAALKKYTDFNEAEQELLNSWRRPIVLLKSKKELAPSVNNQFHRMGAMLPYMPFHHQLMEKLNVPAVVLTSGNFSDEPIILDNDRAVKNLAGIADAFLVYNRDIFNRVDDSVSFVVNDKPRLIRRSRGFVPTPIRTKLNIDGIFAAGAELVNCFAIGKENLALMSQHIGDLQNFETYEFYEETIEKYKHLFRLQTKLVAVDMHPDYFSTRYGKKLGLETIEIQHHHSHVASCMAEHGLDEKVIGVSFDGTGFGNDGHIWGGEFFVCDLNEYDRITHFEYVPLPGGDLVTKEPWRTAVSYLYKYFGKYFHDFDLDFLKNIPKAKIELLIEAMDKKINAPLSSSCGRLFDAVSALINLCPVSKFHAEAPMRLESIADTNITESYLFNQGKDISFEPTFREIIVDLRNNIHPGIISAKFHNTIINVIFATASEIRKNTRISKVVLSGGSFQNAILLGETETKLKENNFEVFAHEKVPSNDGGIALGQLAIAAKRRELKCV
jgi:hydrogenase maturation protein HypF